MRFRQVHLDFHTSEHIPNIGVRFDAGKFAENFESARVDSVTLFAKCHHGWSYHPTEVGATHPGLKFDLLNSQIIALQSKGIKTPVYVSAGWDERCARLSPGWRVVGSDGAMVCHNAEPLGAGWATMDFATPYLAYLCKQLEEVVKNYPSADGIFVDICAQQISYSSFSISRMNEAGLDWQNPNDHKKFAEQIQLEFLEAVRASVRKYDPNMGVFFNFGHIRRGRRDVLDYMSHIEVESLPTAAWGYDHFPVSARYVDTIADSYIGMTGKFHHIWGEMGGYKKPEALLYECGTMIANGACCSVGDHLNPDGSIDRSTYKIIGEAFKFVETRESWVVGSKNCAEIGVLSSEASRHIDLAGFPEFNNDADEGVVRVLLEAKYTFDVLDLDCDFTNYKLIILPDCIDVNATVKTKLDDYIKTGGRVLLTGKSGVSEESGFAVDVGAEWLGESEFKQGDYVLPAKDLRASFVDNPLFMYGPSQRIKITDGKPLGDIFDPYFDRSPKHFSGHVNTPPSVDASGYASGSAKGNKFYIAHPIFTTYKNVGAVAMLEIAENVIAKSLGQAKTVETSLPRAGRVTLRHQVAKNRSILHMTYATPVQRGRIGDDLIQPIQELVALQNINVSLRDLPDISSVKIVPDEIEISFKKVGNEIQFTVPNLYGHCMVELQHTEGNLV